MIGDGETAPYALAAAVYDGVVMKGDALAGTIQVKVAKWSKGASKVTASVQLGTTKLSFKGGVADETGEIDESKLGGNPSGLKLTYKAKDGTFKGTFKAYALEKGKVKAYTLNVSGLLIGDTAYGAATLKKPAVNAEVTISLGST